MAIIQTIRTRAGLLLAIIIGVALLAFILGEFIMSGGLIVQRSRMNVAEINGSRVSYPEYQEHMFRLEQIMKAQYQTNALDQEMSESVREQAWQELIQQYLLDKEYNKLGLGVSDEEFSDLIQGPNPHPLVMQMFSDPNTGMLNRLQLTEFLNNIEEMTGTPKMIWVFYEDVITKQRLLTKYTTLVQKGLYVNKLEVEKREASMSTSVDFSFIQKKYSDISDSSVSVTEAEMKKYYKDNIENFHQEEARDLKYVSFTVTPAEADYKEAEKWIKDIENEFAGVEDIEQYINFTSPPYDPTNYKKGELPDSLDQFMFNANLGDIYGPYFEDNAYKLAKLAKINYISDSVRASHILLPANQGNVDQMRYLADSLKNLAAKGHSFADLVQQNSSDFSTRSTGGDLGWFREGFKGQFFSDSCFYAKTGEVKVTFSEEGFHVVKVTAKSSPEKKVQVGVLSREVNPGSKTDQTYYKQAVEFASSNTTLEKFEAAVSNSQPFAIPAYGIQPLDNEVQGIADSRPIVRWAFDRETKVGDMLKEIKLYGDSYIVAIVTAIYEEGYAPFEQVSEQVKDELIKQKKAELISAELNGKLASASSIDDISSEMNLPVNSANGIRMSSYSVPTAGTEPALIGAAVNAPEQQLTGPIVGENGVYVFYVDNKNTVENQNANPALTRSYLERNYASRANRLTYEKIKDLGKIKDYRYKFF